MTEQERDEESRVVGEDHGMWRVLFDMLGEWQEGYETDGAFASRLLAKYQEWRKEGRL